MSRYDRIEANTNENHKIEIICEPTRKYALTPVIRRFPMNNFKRENLLFSLCGLYCGMCPMKLNQYFPGCGGGDGNHACPIAKCNLQHKNVEYCFQCESYPCKSYENIDKFDSFITHQHQKSDMKKFRELGVDLYSAEQQRKKVLLDYLLSSYNDERKKHCFVLQSICWN